jgi:amidase
MTYRHSYLFSINPNTPSLMKVQPDEEFRIEVLGSLAEVPDVKTIPTPFTPECEGHPLTPIAGPIIVHGAEPGDAVAIDLIEITPRIDGVTAILRNFGVLKDEFAEPKALACPVRDGKAWFADRIPIPLYPNLGTISTMPPEGYKPSYAGAYGGDFDQKDVGVGSRVHLPVIHPGAQVFFADPHAVISDGIISGTGIECSASVRARIGLNKSTKLDRPIIEQADTIQILGWGPTVEAATEDASRGAVDFVASRTPLSREEAYMLLGITGELRVGTSPRPVMCARLMIPRAVLESAGMTRVV